jgi:cyclophilin family peptidyl-prolyl cis-trans isomerase
MIPRRPNIPRPRLGAAALATLRLAVPRLAVPALAVAVSLAVAACSNAGASPTLPPISPEATTAAASHPPCPTSQPAPLPADQTRTVTIQTKLGDIVIKVEGKLAPIAAGNFVALAECGYYDNVDFHRVVPNFVIQGGDGQFGREPNVDMSQIGSGGPGYTIQDEKVTATYGRGTVAMARTSAPNSQGSQFFIVQTDAARQALQAANTYAIFGTVTKGMEVVDLIVGSADAEIPTHPIVMQSVTVANP